MNRLIFTLCTFLIIYNTHGQQPQPSGPFQILEKMLDDLQIQIGKVDKSLEDVLSEMPIEGSSSNPVYIQVEMLQDYIGKYKINKTNQNMHTLDDQILSLKSDVENGELIVANLLLFKQVRLDPKVSAAFHQVQFTLRALLYHINTVGQFLYNFWQSQAQIVQAKPQFVKG